MGKDQTCLSQHCVYHDVNTGGNVWCVSAGGLLSGLSFCLLHSILVQILGHMFMVAFRYSLPYSFNGFLLNAQ